MAGLRQPPTWNWSFVGRKHEERKDGDAPVDVRTRKCANKMWGFRMGRRVDMGNLLDDVSHRVGFVRFFQLFLE